MSVQMSVQVPAPAGERWIFTLAIGSSEVATAAMVAVPRSGEPGFVTVTATELNAEAVAKEVAPWAEEATKFAPEGRAPLESTSAASSGSASAASRRFTPRLRWARSGGGLPRPLRATCRRGSSGRSARRGRR